MNATSGNIYGSQSAQPTTEIVEQTSTRIAIVIDGKTFGIYVLPEDSDLTKLRAIVANPDWDELTVNAEIERLWSEDEKLNEREGEPLGGDGINAQWRM